MAPAARRERALISDGKKPRDGPRRAAEAKKEKGDDDHVGDGVVAGIIRSIGGGNDMT